ncbi:acyltransferase [Shewanella decolorationis]|uniref:Acyltransferase n=1 Tax=Shewanella decolorationis TaxID=256839 RepID=A0A5B8QWJ5_9GAMM|nr:acyltransferase [Shewanella decolorationis]QDZ90398.1 acyltransferase [Shewanella decolorationis]
MRRILNLFYNPYRAVKKYKNVKVDDTAVLLKSARFDITSDDNKVCIGENSMVGCTFCFESSQGEIAIGSNTFINGSTILIARNSISIGSNVTIAWGCTIYDHNSHSLDFLERRKDIARQREAHAAKKNFISNKDWSTVKSSGIKIGDDAWIGFNCIILKGVTIGAGAIVGAGSVVREDVAPWTVVAGNPAVFIKSLKREE